MARHNHADISNYTPMSQGGLERAVDAVQYYAHRADSEGATQYRGGFDSDSDTLNKSEMLDALTAARDGGAKYVYSVVLSPDHRLGERDLKEYARDVLDGVLRERHGRGLQWTAIIHDNQNAHPHVHVVLLTEKTLNRTEFRHFNRRVDKAWPAGGGHEPDQAQEQVQEHQQGGGEEWTR